MTAVITRVAESDFYWFFNYIVQDDKHIHDIIDNVLRGAAFHDNMIDRGTILQSALYDITPDQRQKIVNHISLIGQDTNMQKYIAQAADQKLEDLLADDIVIVPDQEVTLDVSTFKDGTIQSYEHNLNRLFHEHLGDPNAKLTIKNGMRLYKDFEQALNKKQMAHTGQEITYDYLDKQNGKNAISFRYTVPASSSENTHDIVDRAPQGLLGKLAHLFHLRR